MEIENNNWPTKERFKLEDLHDIVEHFRLKEAISSSLIAILDQDTQNIAIKSDFIEKNPEFQNKTLSDLLLSSKNEYIKLIEKCELPLTSYNNFLPEFSKFTSIENCEINSECENLLHQIDKESITCSLSVSKFNNTYNNHFVNNQDYYLSTSSQTTSETGFTREIAE